MSEILIETLIGMARGRVSVPAGGHVFHERDPIHSLFVVEAGAVDLVRFRADGAPMILQRAASGTVLAEASLYADHYHCDGIAVTACTLAEIPKPAFERLFARDPSFASMWAAHLAHAVQSARRRSEILTQKTVAERLDSWLDWHAVLPDKGGWKDLAAEIGVSPEALYRELAARRAG